MFSYMLCDNIYWFTFVRQYQRQDKGTYMCKQRYKKDGNNSILDEVQNCINASKNQLMAEKVQQRMW